MHCTQPSVSFSVGVFISRWKATGPFPFFISRLLSWFTNGPKWFWNDKTLTTKVIQQVLQHTTKTQCKGFAHLNQYIVCSHNYFFVYEDEIGYQLLTWRWIYKTEGGFQKTKYKIAKDGWTERGHLTVEGRLGVESVSF